MPTPPPLPADLQQRLLAAGVHDEESLHEALAGDATLRQDYEAWLVGMTLQAFAETPDVAALEDLVSRAPILLEPPMLAGIERAVQQALAVGDEEIAEALIQRAEALKEIKARRQAQKPSPLAQALIAFLQASDEEAAQQVFLQYEELLGQDEAEHMLRDRFEAEDVAGERRLEARRGLLHTLRMAASA